MMNSNTERDLVRELVRKTDVYGNQRTAVGLCVQKTMAFRLW